MAFEHELEVTLYDYDRLGKILSKELQSDCDCNKITYEWNEDEERWQWKQPKGREIFDIDFETGVSCKKKD